MANESTPSSGLMFDVSQHLGGIFRHMLPGVLVVGGAALAYPDRFVMIDLKSWQHLLLLAIVTVTVGNTWFALNRYGLQQLVDYMLYLIKSDSPARGAKRFSYLDDLSRYTSKSLHTTDRSARARQHVAFRASTVLLLLTIGEVGFVFSVYHGDASIFRGHEVPLRVGSLVALAVGLWQMVITRRIDHFVVTGTQE